MADRTPHEDTSEIQQEIFRAMTPEQRFLAAHRLYWSAREFKAASLRTWGPELSEQEIQQKVRESFMYARS